MPVLERRHYPQVRFRVLNPRTRDDCGAGEAGEGGCRQGEDRGAAAAGNTDDGGVDRGAITDGERCERKHAAVSLRLHRAETGEDNLMRFPNQGTTIR